VQGSLYLLAISQTLLGTGLSDVIFLITLIFLPFLLGFFYFLCCTLSALCIGEISLRHGHQAGQVAAGPLRGRLQQAEGTGQGYVQVRLRHATRQQSPQQTVRYFKLCTYRKIYGLTRYNFYVSDSPMASFLPDYYKSKAGLLQYIYV
jgi:hypothetical protein